MKVIGLVGKKYAGKDTFVGFTRRMFPKDTVVQLGFADALKSEICAGINAVNALYGNPGEPITPEYINKHKEKFRLILQGWGTEFRRDLCRNDYWTHQMLRRLNSYNDSIQVVCIPDVRFLNEAALVKEIGGTIVKIERPATDDYSDEHPSEKELEKIEWDFVINNNGTMERFKDEVELTMKLILKGY